MSGVEILPVRSGAELDRFIRLPARLYRDDPHFVPPLLLERKEALSPAKNPYFAHAETQLFLARRDGRDVGRISAQVDRLVRDPELGHFGMIAAEDDAEAFEALFGAAEAWLQGRGRRRAVGPFNLSINEESGLLIDGFATPPMMFMAHDPAYAAARIEAQGYAKAKDTIAYLYDVEHELPLAARRLIDARRPPALTVRALDKRRYGADFDLVTSIFNDAWSANWGFIPFTKAEIGHMAKSLKPLIDPRWVAIAELDGEAVGFGILLPNLNEAIADFGGRLLPLNWLTLLLRLKRGTRTGRVPLMGIRRSHCGGVMGGLISYLIIDRLRAGARARRMQKIELSWILEDNRPMRHVIESLGAKAYKTYRLYEKALA
jgi:hypothetical protein